MTTNNVCLTEVKGTVMQICNNKYVIASTQTTNIEIFAFVAVIIKA